MARIGYSRVSTLDQDLDGQVARLKAEGCTIVRSEKVSGASRVGRPELAIVLQFLRAGDELVVTRLDRLGRDTRDVLNLIYECEQRGASVTVLDPHVSTRGEMGQCCSHRPRHGGSDGAAVHQGTPTGRYRAGRGRWPICRRQAPHRSVGSAGAKGCWRKRRRDRKRSRVQPHANLPRDRQRRLGIECGPNGLRTNHSSSGKS